MNKMKKSWHENIWKKNYDRLGNEMWEGKIIDTDMKHKKFRVSLILREIPRTKFSLIHALPFLFSSRLNFLFPRARLTRTL